MSSSDNSYWPTVTRSQEEWQKQWDARQERFRLEDIQEAEKKVTENYQNAVFLDMLVSKKVANNSKGFELYANKNMDCIKIVSVGNPAKELESVCIGKRLREILKRRPEMVVLS